jgi:hypothetical protein
VTQNNTHLLAAKRTVNTVITVADENLEAAKRPEIINNVALMKSGVFVRIFAINRLICGRHTKYNKLGSFFSLLYDMMRGYLLHE